MFGQYSLINMFPSLLSLVQEHNLFAKSPLHICLKNLTMRKYVRLKIQMLCEKYTDSDVSQVSIAIKQIGS